MQKRTSCYMYGIQNLDFSSWVFFIIDAIKAPHNTGTFTLSSSTKPSKLKLTIISHFIFLNIKGIFPGAHFVTFLGNRF